MSNQLKEALLQSGVKGRSGRYKLGSGARPYQDDRFNNSPLRKKSKKGIGGKLKSLISKGSKKAVNEIEEVSKKKLTKLMNVNVNRDLSICINIVTKCP